MKTYDLICADTGIICITSADPSAADLTWPSQAQTVFLRTSKSSLHSVSTGHRHH